MLFWGLKKLICAKHCLQYTVIADYHFYCLLLSVSLCSHSTIPFPALPWAVFLIRSCVSFGSHLFLQSLHYRFICISFNLCKCCCTTGISREVVGSAHITVSTPGLFSEPVRGWYMSVWCVLPTPPGSTRPHTRVWWPSWEGLSGICWRLQRSGYPRRVIQEQALLLHHVAKCCEVALQKGPANLCPTRTRLFPRPLVPHTLCISQLLSCWRRFWFLLGRREPQKNIATPLREKPD